METALFWIIWGIVSFWALKTFFFSFSQEKLEGLRKANIGFSFAVLILFFLPWVPLSMDGWTGFGLALQGNFLAAVFFVLLLVSLVLFFQKEYLFLKIAALLTIFLTLDLFTLMLSVRPGTFILSLYDIAPIVASLLLLCQIVAVLLLWQQMQLQSEQKIPNIRKKIIITVVSLLIFSLGFLIYLLGTANRNYQSLARTDENMAKTKTSPPKGYEAFAKQESGKVCSGKNHFSFQVDSPYKVLSDDDGGIALFTNNSLVTVSESNKNIEENLTELKMEFTKEENMYFYELPASGSAEVEDSIDFGISREKEKFLVSVFHSRENIESARLILDKALETIKEGCGKSE